MNRHSECIVRKREVMEAIENKLDLGLDRWVSLRLLSLWCAVILFILILEELYNPVHSTLILFLTSKKLFCKRLELNMSPTVICHKFLVSITVHDSTCAFAGVQPLSARRYELGRRFFRSVTQSKSCLHDLRQRRDSEILSRLWRHSVYPIPLTKTNKYRSFIHYVLAKYQ